MILVTGGTGLVGSHLLYHLTTKNDEVLAIFRSEESKNKVKNVFSLYTPDFENQFQKIIWQEADITEITSLEKVFSSHQISQVYHCVAMISFDENDYQKMRQINIGGTANIVNFCIDFSVKKICHVSSIATLGSSIKQKIIDEENQWNNEDEKSEYAITKNGAEMEVWRASQEGVEVVIVNPAVILGSGFSNGSSAIFTRIKNEFKFYTKGITGFIGVADVVKAMILLMNSDVKNERFVLVSENKSFKDVLFLIADTLKVKRPNMEISKMAMSIFWRLDWLVRKITRKKHNFTKEMARSANKKSCYSSEKFKKYFPDFKFKKINFVIQKVCNDNLFQ